MMATIDALPTELLCLVFHNFRLHQLLSVLSFVCKRWRRAVLRLVTRFNSARTSPANQHSFALLAHLPNLTHVALFGSPAPADLMALPPSVTSLAYEGYWGLAVAALPPLREVRVRTCGVCLPDLLRHTALETLRLDGYMNEHNAAALVAARLPSLSCLQIIAETDSLAPLCHFASQLTSLTMVGASFARTANVPSPAFTRLRRLELSELKDDSGTVSPWIVRLFDNVPQLTELHVDGQASVLPPTLYRSLASLACDYRDWDDAIGAIGTVQLHLKGSWLPVTLCAFSAPCLQRLASYELLVDVKVAGGQWLWPLARTPNVRQLTVHSTFPLHGQVSQRTPALHTLCFEWLNAGKQTYAQLVAPVYVLMAAAPLRHVRISLRKGVPRGDAGPLYSLLSALAKLDCAIVLEGFTSECASGIPYNAWADITVRKCKNVK